MKDFFFFFLNLIYFWLHLVFVDAGGLSLVAEHRLSSTGSIVVAHGIFLNQGSNLCVLHWQVDH